MRNVSAYRISDYDGNLSEYASATKSDSDGNYELVLEDGQYYMNQEIEVVVTSALQTAAGRMIFAKPLHSQKKIKQ